MYNFWRQRVSSKSVFDLLYDENSCVFKTSKAIDLNKSAIKEYKNYGVDAMKSS